MKHFVAGFCVASLFWIGGLVAEPAGLLNLFGLEVGDEPVETVEVELPFVEEKSTKKGKKGRGKRRNKKGRSNRPEDPGYEVGDGASGDSLGTPGSGEMEMGGKEDQLTEAEIDRGIDRVFSGIERCLVLVPPEAPTAGKVIVGMRITSLGRVNKASLKGPKALVNGEAGSCIRRNVKSIKYPSFDGPDMVVSYPITFE